MRIRKVNRYYCEFCKKANCCASAMAKHEQRCTNNPNRKCGMCQVMEKSQPKMQDLLECLPDLHWIDNDVGGVYLGPNQEDSIASGMIALRKVSGDCPACILSALRQKRIPIPLAGFDFKKECTAIWTAINDSRSEYE